jgi:polyphosphate kinase 2 (PPK2 family)
MDFRRRFVVEPGSKVHLDKIDASFKGKGLSHKDALPEIAKQVARMDRLQYLLYADGDQSLLVVLQALDAGGKDGVVRHLFSGMNPQGTTAVAFKQPSSRAAEQPRGRPRLSVACPSARPGQGAGGHLQLGARALAQVHRGL